jgi:hypothetical protein
MKGIVLAILALAVFGIAKLPFERQLTKDFLGAKFYAGQVNLGMRKQIGQEAAIAALSGFRSAVADGLWIRAYVAWEHTQWGKMKVLFDATTALQPRALPFWEGAAWHMAYNASVAHMNDPSQPRLAARIKARNEDYQLGEAYLLRGIEYNPDHAVLYDRLGQIYADKMKDHCKAAWAYFEAAARPDAMMYVHRLAVYELARCPGHEAQAYKMLVELYHKGKEERLPTLLKLINELQIKLDIPLAERIDTTADLREATPR